MSHTKTAVSIENNLFREAETMAHKLEISRSQLYAKALESFIKQTENKQLLQQINDANTYNPDEKEQTYRKRIKSYHRKNVRGEW